MRIVSFQVNTIQTTLGENSIVFDFTSGVNIIYSAENSVGKTTLLRFIMHGLGYSIPNTRGIKFSDYQTVVTIVSDKSTEPYILTRNREYIELRHSGEEKNYSLPVEQNELHSVIFGITNLEVVDNLLGAFYVDQEKGWTLLNRGKAIGNVHFSIEVLLRGLSNRTNDELSLRLDTVKRELRKYRHMRDIAAYKAEINKMCEIAFIDSPADEIESALDLLYSERKPVSEELRRVKDVLRGNTNFEKFVTELRIRVRTPSGEEIAVNKDTIVGYSDMYNLLAAKMRYTSEQLAVIDGKITKLKARQDREATLIDIKTNIEQFDEDISKLNIDALATERIIAKLEREQKTIEEGIVKSVKQNNPLVAELHQLISNYAARLDLDEKYIRANDDYIFTNDLKSLSGAIFHKVVYAFTIAYVKLIEQSVGVVLPIILDSPSGREVSKENVDEMIAILNSDFRNHQIIIASIHEGYDFDDKNIIELRERLLPF